MRMCVRSPVHRGWYQEVLDKCLREAGLVEERSCAASREVREHASVALFPRSLESHGVCQGRGLGAVCQLGGTFHYGPPLLLLGNQLHSALPHPTPCLVKVLTPSRRLRFCKNKDKHRNQAKATMAWEQALG